MVPAEYAEAVAAKLSVHGVRFERLKAGADALAVQAFRATQVKLGTHSVEGHQMAEISGTWGDETRAVPAGSLFVPIAQPLARLVMNLLEPDAPDSLAAWGGFANAFEGKEYMEPYVAEQVAREQLAASPALREEFAARLQSDPAFAASARQRLDFFYRRSPSWDERYLLYPVLRLDQRPAP
ncbi:MAG: hypothetical protein DI539_31490 [Flavobacterium psychrophilum]|nr:MAG: hypothetical protein DI539_31490 [Flavobacterium psychrophilum]